MFPSLHTAVQKVADLVLLLICQVSRTVQVKGQFPELHKHPRALCCTCQQVSQLQVNRGLAAQAGAGMGIPFFGSWSHFSWWKAFRTEASSQPIESASSTMSNSKELLP